MYDEVRERLQVEHQHWMQQQEQELQRCTAEQQQWREERQQWADQQLQRSREAGLAEIRAREWELVEMKEGVERQRRVLQEKLVDVGQEVRAEWQGWPGRGLAVGIGPEEVGDIRYKVLWIGKIAKHKGIGETKVLRNFSFIGIPVSELKWAN